MARISLLNGDVAVRRADSGDYIAAAVNAPLMAQDSVSTGPRSRAEVQFDYADRLRLASNSEVHLTGIDTNRIQMEMSRGEATFSVMQNDHAQVEISTPSVSLRPLRRGSYRVYVSENGETRITVNSGEAEVYTPQGVERVPAGRTLVARGSSSNPEFQILNAEGRDDWDNWNEHRDRDLERSDSYRYVSRDISGAEDLDSYGNWVQDPTYGNVWAPRVQAGWAPYREGRWVWEDFYGWTWVSTDPWGWAPYHYGSWFSGVNGWCWYPGNSYERHFWRPALVAFFGFGGGYGGGLGFGIGFGNVGWVPLAPFEAYRPWYGPGYYGGGYGQTVINNVNIVNNTNITNIYRNANVTNGITGVSSQDFANGRFNNRINIPGQQIRQANLVTGVVPVVPTNNALRYSDRQTAAIARGNFTSPGQQQFFTHTQPATVNRVPFAEQQRNLQQASRQILSGQNPRGGAQTLTGPSGNVARVNPADYRSNPATALSGAQSAAPTGANSRWRQADPVRGNVNVPTQVQNGAGYRGSPANPAQPSSAQPGNAGWSRFGGTGRSAGRQPAYQPAPQYQGQPASRDGSGWSRFGNPAQAQQQPPKAQYQRPTVQDNGSGWSRFGTPQNRSLPEPHNQPRFQPPPSAPAPQPRDNRQSYGNASGYSTSPRNYDSGRQTYRDTGSSYSRPLQIAPPIVRERPQRDPSYSRQEIYNSGGYSTPRYSAPSTRPAYSAPAPSYSRQPNYSAPHYSAPTSWSSDRSPSPAPASGARSQNRNRGDRGH